MVQENECNPQQILNSSEDQQVNHSESTDDRYEKMENNFVKTTIFSKPRQSFSKQRKILMLFFQIQLLSP